MRMTLIAVAAAWLAISPAWAQTVPSFDCARARTAVEKAICNDPAIAASDARAARRLRKAQSAYDAATAGALQEDQRYFIAVRDEGFAEPWDGRPPTEWLATLQRQRADFLGSLKTIPGKGLVGHWGNLPGGLDIVSVGNGVFSVSLNAVDPHRARWVCDIHAQGTSKNGILMVEDPEVEGWQLTLRRQGAAVVVREVAKPGTETNGYSPYCGMNGSVTGPYFPLTRSQLMGAQGPGAPATSSIYQMMVYAREMTPLRSGSSATAETTGQLSKGQYLCVVYHERETTPDEWIEVKAVPFANGRNTLCSGKDQNPLCGKVGNYPVRWRGKSQGDQSCRLLITHPEPEGADIRALGNCAGGWIRRDGIGHIGD